MLSYESKSLQRDFPKAFHSFILVLKLVHAFTGNLNGGVCGPMIKFSDNLKMEKSNNGKGLNAKSFQSCPSLCDPMDCSLPGSSVHGIFQARILEWVAVSFSNECESWTVKKAECQRIDAFELRCWRRLESPLLQGDQSSKS